MADHSDEDPTQGSSTASSPSIKAARALEAFRDEKHETYRPHMFLMSYLIPFLVDVFDMQANPDLLPDQEDDETLFEEALRHNIVVRLMDEFGQSVEWDIQEEDRFRDHHYSLFTTVFCRNFNRQPRQPSHLRRSEPVETTAERRVKQLKS